MRWENYFRDCICDLLGKDDLAPEALEASASLRWLGRYMDEQEADGYAGFSEMAELALPETDAVYQ